MAFGGFLLFFLAYGMMRPRSQPKAARKEPTDEQRAFQHESTRQSFYFPSNMIPTSPKNLFNKPTATFSFFIRKAGT
jgi:hypothetical protein